MDTRQPLEYKLSNQDFYLYGEQDRNWVKLRKQVWAISREIQAQPFETVPDPVWFELYILLAGFDYGASYEVQQWRIQLFSYFWRRQQEQTNHRVDEQLETIAKQHDISLEVTPRLPTEDERKNTFYEQVWELLDSLDEKHTGDKSKEMLFEGIDNPNKRQALRYLYSLVRGRLSVPMVMTALMRVLSFSTPNSRTDDILKPAFYEFCTAQGLIVNDLGIVLLPENLHKINPAHARFLLLLSVTSIIIVNSQLRPTSSAKSHGNVFEGDTACNLITQPGLVEKGPKKTAVELRVMYDLVLEGLMPAEALIHALKNSARQNKTVTVENKSSRRLSFALRKRSSSMTKTQLLGSTELASCESLERIKTKRLSIDNDGVEEKALFPKLLRENLFGVEQSTMLDSLLQQYPDAAMGFLMLKTLLDHNQPQAMLYNTLFNIRTTFAKALASGRFADLNLQLGVTLASYEENTQQTPIETPSLFSLDRMTDDLNSSYSNLLGGKLQGRDEFDSGAEESDSVDQERGSEEYESEQIEEGVNDQDQLEPRIVVELDDSSSSSSALTN